MQLTRLSTVMPIGLVRLVKPLAMPLLLPKARRFFSSFVGKGDLVFDIGAHEGEMADIFLSLGAEVVCVEPNPACVKALEKRFGGNGSVRIIGKGLGERAGRLELSICEGSSSLSTFSEKWKTGRYSGQKWAAHAEAEITTMDSLIAEFGTPRFCKIDVEGYELQVMRGLSTGLPCLSFEFTKEFLEDARSCLERLSRLGMRRFNYSPYGESSLSLEGWVGKDALMSKLSEDKDGRLWGDIYSMAGTPAPASE